MSLDIALSDAHEMMLDELRDEYGGEINRHIRQVVESEIHESYQQLRMDESDKTQE